MRIETISVAVNRLFFIVVFGVIPTTSLLFLCPVAQSGKSTVEGGEARIIRWRLGLRLHTASLEQRTRKSRQASRNRGYKRSIGVIVRSRDNTHFCQRCKICDGGFNLEVQQSMRGLRIPHSGCTSQCIFLGGY